MYLIEKTIFFLAIAICLISGFSCKYKQQQLLFEAKKNPEALTTLYLTPKNYRVRPQDLLQIKNLQNRNYIANNLMLKESGEVIQYKSQKQLLLRFGDIQQSIIVNVPAALIERITNNN